LIARELINKNLPVLNCTDTGQKVLNIMESFWVSHLPVVSGDNYIGLVSEKLIYDSELEMCELNQYGETLERPFIHEGQHIYEVAGLVKNLKLTVLPVLTVEDVYCGAISINDLAEKVSDLLSVSDPGAVIVIELSPNDYSLSQIAQIVESNDAKILSLYTKNINDSMELDVTIKLSVSDISSIIETFARYDYNIKAVYTNDSAMHDMYDERYEMFMKYIDL
jgi:acetoin utilization protein AcuB